MSFNVNPSTFQRLKTDGILSDFNLDDDAQLFTTTGGQSSSFGKSGTDAFAFTLSSKNLSNKNGTYQCESPLEVSTKSCHISLKVGQQEDRSSLALKSKTTLMNNSMLTSSSKKPVNTFGHSRRQPIALSSYAKSTSSSRFYKSLKKPVENMWSEPRPGSAPPHFHEETRQNNAWSPKIQELYVKAPKESPTLTTDLSNTKEYVSSSIMKNNGELSKDLVIVLDSQLEHTVVANGNHVNFSRRQIRKEINHHQDSKISLAMFKHIKGSKVCEGMYDDFRLETGEIVHFYQKGELLNGPISPCVPDFPP